jgi:hypothetical protein
MIGIATVARPDDEGIRNDSGRKSRNMTITKVVELVSPSAFSHQCSTVSVISPLFMITVIRGRSR